MEKVPKNNVKFVIKDIGFIEFFFDLSIVIHNICRVGIQVIVRINHEI